MNARATLYAAAHFVKDLSVPAQQIRQFGHEMVQTANAADVTDLCGLVLERLRQPLARQVLDRRRQVERR